MHGRDGTDESNTLFRFQDVVVFSALADALDERQRVAMLGAASHWLSLDVFGYPHAISRPGQPIRGAALELTQQQLSG